MNTVHLSFVALFQLTASEVWPISNNSKFKFFNKRNTRPISEPCPPCPATGSCTCSLKPAMKQSNDAANSAELSTKHYGYQQTLTCPTAELPALVDNFDLTSYWSNCGLVLINSRVTELKTGAFSSLRRKKIQIAVNENLRVIRKGAFKGGAFEELDIVDNEKLEKIEDGAFSGIQNFPGSNQFTLQLTDNNELTLNASTFAGANTITGLILLGGHRTHIVKRGLFRELSSLRVLQISGLNFRKIENGAFTDLPSSVRQLVLMYTNITKLPKQSLDGLENIERLWIEFNPKLKWMSGDLFNESWKLAELVFANNSRLVSLPKSVVALKNLKSLNLDGNALRCNSTTICAMISNSESTLKLHGNCLSVDKSSGNSGSIDLANRSFPVWRGQCSAHNTKH